MINKIIKQNYNSVIKLLIICIFLNFLVMMSMILQNVMFYKANFGGINVTQNVNINTEQKEKININNCSKEALKSLPSIGEIKANSIINNRPYSDIYELKNIIGETAFYNLKEKIKV